MESEVVSTEMSDQDMNAALGESGPSRDIPLESAPAPVAQEFELTVNGKQIKANAEQVKQWAQMGYNYPQKAGELNQRQQEFEKQKLEYETKFKDYETKYSPYKAIDEYAAKNPDWWKQTQEAYNQKAQASGLPPEISQLKEELMKELSPVKEFMQNSQAEKQAQKAEQEDKQLTSEIESIRKTYTNIDFDTPDGEGKSLEMKVLEHAMQNDMKSFRVAFRDFYHDQLVGKAKEEGKEIVSKTIQQKSKLGILGETSKPTQGLKMAENVRNKTYEQLAQEAIAELNHT